MANIWTAEEDARLKALYEAGTNAKEIADKIGRSRSSVFQRISGLGLAKLKRAESSTPIPPKPDPVEPVAKRRYKIRYLVDGIEEKTIPVIAKDEKTAKAGLLKKLESKDNMRTYEIIRIEDVEIASPDPIIQEIQQGIEEKFGYIEPKEEAVEEQEPIEETTNTVEEVKPVEYEGTIELTTQELPLVYYDCERCLTVKGITLSPEETLKVVDFAVQVWKTL